MAYTDAKATEILLHNKFLEEIDAKYQNYPGVFSAPKPGSSVKDTVMRYYIKRLSLTKAQYLYNHRRECSVAETLGILYTLGVGLPVNSDYASFWYHRRTLPNACDCPMFEDLSKILRKQLTKVLPRASRYLYDSVTSKLEKCYKLVELQPSFNMVPVCLVYVAVGRSYYFNNLIIDQDTYAYAIRNVQGIPSTIDIIPSHKYLIVTGALLPTSDFVRSKKQEEIPLNLILRRHLRSFECADRKVSIGSVLAFGRSKVYNLDSEWEFSNVNVDKLVELKSVFRVLKSK